MKTKPVREIVTTIERKTTLVEKTCPAPSCGKTFWGRSNQQFCSRACRNRTNYHRNAAQYRAERMEKYHQQKRKAVKA